MQMTMKKNPLSGDWLCMIPEYPSQAYYYEDKRSARRFITAVNDALDSGELYTDDEGILQQIRRVL
jgi:hypothetical protein